MFPVKIKVSNNLIRYEKNGRMLLVNGAESMPLLVNRGKGHVKKYLANVVRLGDTSAMLEQYGDERLLRTLIGHKILVDADSAEEYPAPTVPDISPPKAMSLYLLLSQGCNLRCRYCLNGEHTYMKSERPLMDERTAVAAVEVFLNKLDAGGELEIVFFGGEPMLNWPVIKKVINYCEGKLKKRLPDRRWRYHITTNLTIFPVDFVEWIKRYRITLLCNIDGPPSLHDRTRPFRNGRPSHGRIAQNLFRLLDENIGVPLRCTVTSHNVHHMMDVAEHHRRLGGTGCAFVPVNAVTSDEDILAEAMLPDPGAYRKGLIDVFNSSLWAPEELFPFNQYMKAIKPGLRTTLPCGAPYGNTPVVDVNGDTYACIYLVGISAYRTGNIFVESSAQEKRVVKRMKDVLYVDNIPGCSDCSLRYVCVSGCPVGTLTIAQNPAASESVKNYTKAVKCGTIEAVFESLMWHYAEAGVDKLRARDHPDGAPC